MTGPLRGCRVIELGGVGPGPLGGSLLADMGADVVRVDRPPGAASLFPGSPRLDLLNRGKRSVALDLKRPAGLDALLELIDDADVVIDPFRPGVAERLGFGPDVALQRNPRLVFARMTGWGQVGPLAGAPGHDINYLAPTGVLAAIGQRGGPPAVPLNVVGDFGGGATFLVIGVLAALREVGLTGRGQVVDVAIVDGVAQLLTGVHALMNANAWTDARGVNILDGGAPYYRVYETADGHFMAVGAMEPQFYREFLRLLPLPEDPGLQLDRSRWPQLITRISEIFRSRTRAEWTAVFDGTEACVTPVLSLSEAAGHPHLAARASIVEVSGTPMAGAAPRFSLYRTGSSLPPPLPGEHTQDVLPDADKAVRP